MKVFSLCVWFTFIVFSKQAVIGSIYGSENSFKKRCCGEGIYSFLEKFIHDIVPIEEKVRDQSMLHRDVYPIIIGHTLLLQMKEYQTILNLLLVNKRWKNYILCILDRKIKDPSLHHFTNLTVYQNDYDSYQRFLCGKLLFTVGNQTRTLDIKDFKYPLSLGSVFNLLSFKNICYELNPGGSCHGYIKTMPQMMDHLVITTCEEEFFKPCSYKKDNSWFSPVIHDEFRILITPILHLKGRNRLFLFHRVANPKIAIFFSWSSPERSIEVDQCFSSASYGEISKKSLSKHYWNAQYSYGKSMDIANVLLQNMRISFPD